MLHGSISSGVQQDNDLFDALSVAAELVETMATQQQLCVSQLACQLQLAETSARLKSCRANPKIARSMPDPDVVESQNVVERKGQQLLDSQFQSDRLVFQHFMESHWRPPGTGGITADRGLLMVAGPGKLTANAFVNLHVIRNHLGSAIPATLCYWGAQAADRINPATQAFIKVRQGFRYAPGAACLSVACIYGACANAGNWPCSHAAGAHFWH